MSSNPPEVVVLGAGVIGLTTASELHQSFPNARVTIVAKHLPGSTSATEYTSPWAGANWSSFETQFNHIAGYERVSFQRFKEIAARSPESGVKTFPLRICYDTEERAKEERWYQELVGGFRGVAREELPPGTAAGLDMVTFMINTIVYIAWLQSELLQNGVKFERRSYEHIDALMDDYPNAIAFFNCTGLGARHLGGVEDRDVYPTKGQTLLIAEPRRPLERMYVQASSKWADGEFAHVFPRPLGGGVIIGGVRRENDWSGEPDMELAERIKERCCALAPELGRPRDLQVISHNVGLRPTRNGGARVERETRHGRHLIHNYGASGGGYQGSWGMAGRAVTLLKDAMSPRSRL